MNNIQKFKSLSLLILISSSISLFCMNESPFTIATDDSKTKVKLKSKLKKRYKANETQEQIADLAKLQLPLKVICINQLLNNNPITQETEERLAAHGLLPLLKTIQSIKLAGYKNKKLVLRLIKLTFDSDYCPKLHILHNNLREAAFLGDAHAISLLIDRGALQRPIYIRNDQSPHYKKPSSCMIYQDGDHEVLGNFALEAAIKRATRMNQVEIVKILIEKLEQDPHDEYNIIDSGLTHAKTKEMVTVYLAKNGELNVSYGPNDANCLGNAVIAGNLELIDFLLKNNASPIICDESFAEDISAVTYALERMANEDSLIKASGKEIMKQFAHYSSSDEKNVIMHIITSPNIPEDIKMEAIAIVLQAKQININEQDEEGLTALMYAIYELSSGITQLLLKHDADISLTNYDGEKAIDLARARLHINVNEAQKIVNLLQEAQISQSDY